MSLQLDFLVGVGVMATQQGLSLKGVGCFAQQPDASVLGRIDIRRAGELSGTEHSWFCIPARHQDVPVKIVGCAGFSVDEANRNGFFGVCVVIRDEFIEESGYHAPLEVLDALFEEARATIKDSRARLGDGQGIDRVLRHVAHIAPSGPLDVDRVDFSIVRLQQDWRRAIALENLLLLIRRADPQRDRAGFVLHTRQGAPSISQQALMRHIGLMFGETENWQLRYQEAMAELSGANSRLSEANARIQEISERQRSLSAQLNNANENLEQERNARRALNEELRNVNGERAELGREVQQLNAWKASVIAQQSGHSRQGAQSRQVAQDDPYARSRPVIVVKGRQQEAFSLDEDGPQGPKPWYAQPTNIALAFGAFAVFGVMSMAVVATLLSNGRQPVVEQLPLETPTVIARLPSMPARSEMVAVPVQPGVPAGCQTSHDPKLLFDNIQSRCADGGRSCGEQIAKAFRDFSGELQACTIDAACKPDAVSAILLRPLNNKITGVEVAELRLFAGCANAALKAGEVSAEIKADVSASEPVKPTKPQTAEEKEWDTASQRGTAQAYRRYLEKFPNGQRATAAKAKVADLIRIAFSQGLNEPDPGEANGVKAVEPGTSKEKESSTTDNPKTDDDPEPESASGGDGPT
jgi:hypothetical protein